MDRIDEHVRWALAAPVYAGAYCAAASVFWWMARRRGFSPNVAAFVMTAGLLGGLVGADLVQWLATGLPGKAIEGGIAGGWIAVVLAKRALGVTRPTGDLFALALPAGEAIGRVACFIGGCCYGKVTAVAWAVHDHDAWRHPAQLYLALLAAVSFAALCAIERRVRLPENALFYAGGMLFCAQRFTVDFFRDVAATPLGLTAAQLACCAGLIFFACKLAALSMPRNVTAAAG
ncbi:MAG TPA: prolipoprotein diacylglyceryl transferase family protein [Candidatus Baltobacteraceae bacterium]